MENECLEKSFIDLSKDALNKLFTCREVVNQAAVKINHDIQSIISTGISKAINHRLNPVIGQSIDHRLVLGPFVYSQAGFTLNDQYDFFEDVRFKQEPSSHMKLIDEIAASIMDETFIELAMKYAGRSTYEVECDKWNEPERVEDRGVEMDESSMRFTIAIHVLGIAYKLLRSRNKEEASVLDVPDEGIYTIEWQDNHWAIGFTAVN